MVLVVVDTQNLITNKSLYNFYGFVENVEKLIFSARKNNIEVIYVRHDDGEGSEITKGTIGFEIYEKFKPLSIEKIFDKTVNSAFKESGLLKYLKEKNESDVIIAGLQSEYCIDATIKCGFEHNFNIIVPAFCNTTTDNIYMRGEQTYKYYNNFIWKNRYAKCITLNQTVDLMEKQNSNISPKKNIGMVVAVEIDAVLSKYGKGEIVENLGLKVYKYKLGDNNLFVAYSGAGQISATMATQLLISKFNADFIVNFGIVGGLTKEMELTQTCVVESVVHYDFDTSEANGVEVGRYLEYPSIYIPVSKEILDKVSLIYPSLKKVVCASGDKFIASVENKKLLHEKFGADICEMEAAGIVLTCNKNNVPCLLIKTVSDSISGGKEEFFSAANNSAKICMDITDKIINIL